MSEVKALAELQLIPGVLYVNGSGMTESELEQAIVEFAKSYGFDTSLIDQADKWPFAARSEAIRYLNSHPQRNKHQCFCADFGGLWFGANSHVVNRQAMIPGFAESWLASRFTMDYEHRAKAWMDWLCILDNDFNPSDWKLGTIFVVVRKGSGVPLSVTLIRSKSKHAVRGRAFLHRSGFTYSPDEVTVIARAVKATRFGGKTGYLAELSINHPTRERLTLLEAGNYSELMGAK